MHRKPPEFSWFSNALKNIKEKKEYGRKNDNEMEGCHTVSNIYPETQENQTITTAPSEITKNHMIPTVSSTSTNDAKFSDSSLKVNNTEWEKNNVMNTMNTYEYQNEESGIDSSEKPTRDNHRRSLTAKYLEKKNQTKIDIIEEPAIRHSQYNQFPRILQNEGPVRQSLLNLVMDEDVPDLMEAMAEKLEFVFEDLTPSASYTVQGILRHPERHPRSRPKDAKLVFKPSSPTVFTYPNEESAVEGALWDDGIQITYELYRELCDEYQFSVLINYKSALITNHYLTDISYILIASSLREKSYLTRENHDIQQTVTLLEEPSVAESLLGVTGRISYTNVPVFARNSL
ncbi:unnamed protein product [Thelazia callipaeda]|uniref:C2 DOCK-type domain-containing protein n=1 Tax=Thelazia callipaeda TaxID=103827 RepID=A0A0N5D794_THECL|nr:unnamed protein product [Thelazia callipaeda]